MKPFFSVAAAETSHIARASNYSPMIPAIVAASYRIMLVASASGFQLFKRLIQARHVLDVEDPCGRLYPLDKS